MAAFRLTEEKNPVNEVEQYVNARYIGAVEACWRLFEFDTHYHYPPVVALAVHLENGQRVMFTENNARSRVDAPPPRTTLTAFFELSLYYSNLAANSVDKAFYQTLLYRNIPEYFRWNAPTKEWIQRKNGEPVCFRVQETTFKKEATIGRL